MKKIIATMTILSFLCVGVFAAEQKSMPQKQTTTPSAPTATPSVPEKKEHKIITAVGVIEKVSTQDSTITIKKEDNKTLTLKANTPKAKEAISKVKTGDKVKVLYTETKSGELSLMKITSPVEETKKPKNNKI